MEGREMTEEESLPPIGLREKILILAEVARRLDESEEEDEALD